MDTHKNCEVSGRYCFNHQPHHIKAVGAGGPDEDWNLIRLTKTLHIECHQIGNVVFTIKYKVKKMREALIKIGLWSDVHEKLFNK